MDEPVAVTLAYRLVGGQRADLEADVAMIGAVTARFNGFLERDGERLICRFTDTADGIQSAITALRDFDRSGRGTAGLGLGLDAGDDRQAALHLAEWAAQDGSFSALLPEALRPELVAFPGLRLDDYPADDIPGWDGRIKILGLTLPRRSFGDLRPPGAGADNDGWRSVPEAGAAPEKPATGDDTLDETVMAVEAAAELPPAGAAEPIDPDDETVMAVDDAESPEPTVADDDLTIIHTDFGTDVADDDATQVPPAPGGNDDDATLIGISAPDGPISMAPGQASSARAAIDALANREAAARQHLEQGERYRAIQEIDGAVEGVAPADRPGVEGLIDRLQELRDEITDGMWLAAGLLITGGDTRLSLHHGDSLQIGRHPGEPAPGLKLVCRTVSRVPRQVRIDRRELGFDIIELGSSNGAFIDDQRLLPNQPLALDQLTRGMILAMGGVLEPPEKGECRLRLSSPAEAPTTLLLQVDTAHLTETARSQLLADWPELEADAAWRWLFTEEQVLIGGGADCVIRPAGAAEGAPLAAIQLGQRGYALVPRQGPVALDGVAISQPVPIADGAVLTAGGEDFSLSASPG
jgi:hypothetical protein